MIFDYEITISQNVSLEVCYATSVSDRCTRNIISDAVPNSLTPVFHFEIIHDLPISEHLTENNAYGNNDQK